MNKIDWIITGTKKSHAGPEPLLWNDLTINNEDKSLYGLAQNEFVIGLSQTERRSLYRLYTSRVAYSDAMRPGAWLAIGLAIPRGYRLCDKKSPYDLLMKMYATFLDFCMERGADGCYRFKNEDDYSSFKERFTTIVDSFPLEVYDGVYYPMGGTDVRCIVTETEEKMRMLLMDSQYREFAQVKQLHIMEHMGNFREELLMHVDIPRSKRYTLYIDNKLQDRTYLADEQITITLNPRKHYNVKVSPSFKISDCENGGVAYVQVDNRREEVRVFTSSLYEPEIYLCKLQINLEGLDDPSEYSKVTLSHAGRRLELTNNMFRLVGEEIETLPVVVYSGQNEFIPPRGWNKSSRGGWHVELMCTIKKRVPTVTVVSDATNATMVVDSQPTPPKKDMPRCIEVLSCDEVSGPLEIRIYKKEPHKLLYKNIIKLNQQKKNSKGVFYLNNDFDEYDTYVKFSNEELGYCDAVLSKTIQLDNWRKEKKQTAWRKYFILSLLVALSGLLGGVIGVKIHESSSSSDERINSLQNDIRQKDKEIRNLQDSLKNRNEEILRLQNNETAVVIAENNVVEEEIPDELKNIYKNLEFVSFDSKDKKVKSGGDENGYLTLNFYEKQLKTLKDNDKKWGKCEGYKSAVEKTTALIELFGFLKFDTSNNNYNGKKVYEAVDTLLEKLKDDEFYNKIGPIGKQKSILDSIKEMTSVDVTKKLFYKDGGDEEGILMDSKKTLGWSYLYYIQFKKEEEK